MQGRRTASPDGRCAMWGGRPRPQPASWPGSWRDQEVARGSGDPPHKSAVYKYPDRGRHKQRGGQMVPGYGFLMWARSFSFSQNSSKMSLSATRSCGTLMVKGLVYVLGSSKVISTSR